LLDSSIRHSALFEKAAEFGMPAVAMTDHGNMFGAVEFYNEARKHGIKPILGCEVYVAPDSRLEKSSKDGFGMRLIISSFFPKMRRVIKIC
jgi:DNA polymerase III subunit alpha